MFSDSAARAVEAVAILPFLIMGMSHILRPAMWRNFFLHLHGMGETGVVYRSFMLELVPGFVFLTFHQVWSGPGIVLTIYGCLLCLKVSISLLFPQVGLRSLSMAGKCDAGFQVAGFMLLTLGLLCIYLVWWT